MPFGVWSVGRRAALAFAAVLALGAAAQATPYPTPFLVVDADSGQVLIDNEATAVWYPASLTKLMTVYVALDAVRAGKLTGIVRAIFRTVFGCGSFRPWATRSDISTARQR